MLLVWDTQGKVNKFVGNWGKKEKWKCLDKDLVQSILKIPLKFQEDYPNKIIPGYIRHLSIDH